MLVQGSSSVMETNAANKFNSHDRLSACRVLAEGGLSCYVWSEDALSHYGVPTEVWGLYLLVNDVDQAATVLCQHGWSLPRDNFQAPYNDNKEDTRYLINSQLAISMHGTLDEPRLVVGLLAASDWNIELPPLTSPRLESNTSSEHNDLLFMAPLPKLVDSLMGKWLDTAESQRRFRDRLQLFLAYLYDYVSVLRLPDFAPQLRVEHRQIHHDVISGGSMQGTSFLNRSRKSRDEALAGDVVATS